MASVNELNYKTASKAELIRRANDITSRSGPVDASDRAELKTLNKELKVRDAKSAEAAQGTTRLTTDDKKYK